jgi:hypothetical protein
MWDRAPLHRAAASAFQREIFRIVAEFGYSGERAYRRVTPFAADFFGAGFACVRHGASIELCHLCHYVVLQRTTREMGSESWPQTSELGS